MLRRAAASLARPVVTWIAILCAAWLFFGSHSLSAQSSPIDSPPPSVSSPIDSPLPTVPSPIDTPVPPPPSDTPPPSTPTDTPTPRPTACPPSVCTPTPTYTPSRTSTGTPTHMPPPSRTPTRTPLPPPDIRFEVRVSKATVSVGDVVHVDLVARNAGQGLAGLPQYRLLLRPASSPIVLRPAAPPPVTHASVAPGATDTVRYTFVAACPGTVDLLASLSYEVHFGYPGPATWWSNSASAQLQVLAPPGRSPANCPSF